MANKADTVPKSTNLATLHSQSTVFDIISNVLNEKTFPAPVKVRQKYESTTVSVKYEQHTGFSRGNGLET
jgi:hypothetical protein